MILLDLVILLTEEDKLCLCHALLRNIRLFQDSHAFLRMIVIQQWQVFFTKIILMLH
jgi:hypothetical protein